MDVASLIASIVGALVGIAALCVAIAIFLRQQTDQQHFALHVDSRFDEIAARRIRDEPATPGEAPAAYGEQPGSVTRTIEGVNEIKPAEVPLAVLADLWSGMPEDRRGWLLGEVRSAYRKTGKGNHPWYVLLEHRDGSEDAWVARVSRGGQGKTGPTVTLTASEAFFGPEAAERPT